MGRSLSPVVRRELANLDKDADSRKSAMKALKSYVKDLDSKAIPLFLAQVSETKETGSLSGEYTISLYEVLARVHGVNIVPQINSIMGTIIKTLASSAGSFSLQQACSKVVPAIARYGIDPTTPEDKKRLIIHSLCKPLSQALLGSQECLTSGAALCLKALVDSDNWRFASDEMVNMVCQNVAVALDQKCTQSNSHMSLVMALAKHNSLIVEAYARLLIQSGLRILNVGLKEGNSQKRLSAIQMVNFLMKCLDSRSLFSELELVIGEMEKFQSDQMAYVSGAAFEALQTAKKITSEKGSKFEKSSGSVTGSNFRRRDYRSKRNFSRSPASISPESQTLDSNLEYDSPIETPISTAHASPNTGSDRRSVNRKLWSHENGLVDVSLKDGLFSELSRGDLLDAFSDHSGQDLTENIEDNACDFSGFLQHRRNLQLRSATPSPQRSRSRANSHTSGGQVNIFTTPRKLMRSLQDLSDVDSDHCEKQSRRIRSPCLSKFDFSPEMKKQNGFQHNEDGELKESGNFYTGSEQAQGGSESVSSTDDIPVDSDVQISSQEAYRYEKGSQMIQLEKLHRRSHSKLIVSLLFAFLVAATTSVMWIGGQDEGRYLVPT